MAKHSLKSIESVKVSDDYRQMVWDEIIKI
jgi:hypothetical protein